MKNVIIKYGLISGVFAAAFMLATTLILKKYGFENVGFDYSAYIGYTGIIISMAVIFFGIKAFRDKVNGGKVSIGKGFLIGLGITAISSVFYSLMWLVVYYNYVPDFIEEYAKFCSNKLQMSGASAEEMAKNQTQLDQLKEMYKTPLGVFTVTLMEPFPIGVVVALVSALILKKN